MFSNTLEAQAPDSLFNFVADSLVFDFDKDDLVVCFFLALENPDWVTPDCGVSFRPAPVQGPKCPPTPGFVAW